MSAAVAVRLQVDGAMNAAVADWKNRIAGLMGTLLNPETLAAESKHLGHRQRAALPTTRD
jgi:hypothetical protein